MRKFPMNLQFFAEGEGDGNQNNNAGEGNSTPNAGNNQNNNSNATTYTQEQLDGIVNSRVSRAEKSALKSFFEQQGMSEEEINNAISEYKTNKEANKPDVEGMQSQLSQAQQENQRLLVENAATIQAIRSGIPADTVQYVLKMADLSKAMGADGKINDEEVKSAIDKVLEDVPALKPSTENSKGFSFGAPGSDDNNNGNNGLNDAPFLPYHISGTEYKTLAQFGEIKVVKMKENLPITPPMETMTAGRVYATVDKVGDIKHITFYDANGERNKQIDVKGKAHNGLLPHVHEGYEHNEITDRDVTAKEREYIDNLLDQWERRRKRLNI